MCVFGGNKEELANATLLLFFRNEEQAKLKQRGGEKKLLPSVEGQKGGKWIVVDSGIFFLRSLLSTVIMRV